MKTHESIPPSHVTEQYAGTVSAGGTFRPSEYVKRCAVCLQELRGELLFEGALEWDTNILRFLRHTIARVPRSPPARSAGTPIVDAIARPASAGYVLRDLWAIYDVPYGLEVTTARTGTSSL